jgi:hypothetical protein
LNPPLEESSPPLHHVLIDEDDSWLSNLKATRSTNTSLFLVFLYFCPEFASEQVHQMKNNLLEQLGEIHDTSKQAQDQKQTIKAIL